MTCAPAQTCLLCSSTHHPASLALPLSTYIDHWLCPSCHTTEAKKGVQELLHPLLGLRSVAARAEEEEEEVQGKVWGEEKLRKMLRVRRI